MCVHEEHRRVAFHHFQKSVESAVASAGGGGEPLNAFASLMSHTRRSQRTHARELKAKQFQHHFRESLHDETLIQLLEWQLEFDPKRKSFALPETATAGGTAALPMPTAPAPAPAPTQGAAMVYDEDD